MKVKKTIASIMSGSVLMFSLPIGIAITQAQTAGFSDVNETNPNYTAIVYLKSHGVISGYPDGTFKPDQVVNRAEAVKIILLGSGVEVPTSVDLEPFRDTDRTAWYAPYVEKAKELNVVSGYSDGTFKPDQTVNLVENLKILLLTQSVDVKNITVTENPYTDAFKDQWYAPYVEYAKEKNLIDADSKNMIYPAQGMTRGKLAETMYRLMYMKEMNLTSFSTTLSQQAANTTTQQTNQQITSTTQQPLNGITQQLSTGTIQQLTQQTTNTTNQQTVNVQISEMQFLPASITVKSGTKVIWTNQDLAIHTVTKDSASTSTLALSSGNLSNGQTYSATFMTPGTYTYHCAIHPFMTGTVIVTE